MLFTHFIEKLVFQNYASNWSRIINIWYITVSKITNLQLTFNCKVCVRIFLRSIFFFSIFIWKNSQKWEGSRIRDRNSMDHNHEIEIEIEKQRYLSKIYDWVYGRMCVFQLYAQESKFHFRNNHWTWIEYITR